MRFTIVLIFILSSFHCLCQYSSIYEVITNNHDEISTGDLNGVKLDTICYENMFDCFPCAPSTPLQYAVYKKDYSLLKLLLDAGADPDFGDNGGNSPLHFAANHNDTTAALILINGSATIDMIAGKNFNLTPLLVASKWSKPEMVELLLRYGADINRVDCFDKSALDLNKSCCGDGLGESIQDSDRQKTQSILKHYGLQ